jgi:hypothetical protein
LARCCLLGAIIIVELLQQTAHKPLNFFWTRDAKV